MAYTPREGTANAETKKITAAIRNRQITKAAQTLIGICAGIAADNYLHNREIQFLSTWLTENAEVADYWPGSEITRRVREILADGIVTDDERADLLEALKRLSGNDFGETGAASDGPALPIDDDPSIYFKNMTFCLTGRFVFGTRPACERIILARGGMPVDGITKRLDYLVIGTLIEPQWANTTYGRKIEKAVAYRDEGNEITIISERQWTAALADLG